MTITLAPETEAKARRIADREGKSLDAVVNEILAEILVLPGVLDENDEAANGAASTAATTSTSKPLDVYVAEQRQKYGYPPDWPADGSALEVEPGVFVTADK